MCKLSFRSVPSWGVPLVAILVILLGGCDEGGIPQDQVEPPKPTLVGTWRHIEHWQDDSGDRRTETTTLTFTSTRFIEINVDRNANGDINNAWQLDGTWSVTESSVTKTYYPWDDEADARSETAVSVEKEYYWGDATGDVLLVHPWGSDDEEDVFVPFTRVSDPVPSITGVWEYKGGLWNLEPDQGESRTLTFGDSEAFTDDHRFNDDEGRTVNNLLKGSWRHDVKNQLVVATIRSAESDDPTTFLGEAEYAYARSGIGNLVAFSIIFDGDEDGELVYDLLFERQSQ